MWNGIYRNGNGKNGTGPNAKRIRRGDSDMLIYFAHLLIIAAGFAAITYAMISGEWRWLIISAFAYGITTRC